MLYSFKQDEGYECGQKRMSEFLLRVYCTWLQIQINGFELSNIDLKSLICGRVVRNPELRVIERDIHLYRQVINKELFRLCWDIVNALFDEVSRRAAISLERMCFVFVGLRAVIQSNAYNGVYVVVSEMHVLLRTCMCFTTLFVIIEFRNLSPNKLLVTISDH